MFGRFGQPRDIGSAVVVVRFQPVASWAVARFTRNPGDRMHAAAHRRRDRVDRLLGVVAIGTAAAVFDRLDAEFQRDLSRFGPAVQFVKRFRVRRFGPNGLFGGVAFDARIVAQNVAGISRPCDRSDRILCESGCSGDAAENQCDADQSQRQPTLPIHFDKCVTE